ncbi:hypothetical protein [uncultured Tyzzerella sp.]|uniref:hypothetical protein n=1 Tax=uncultured Tyzzerella sp. TaxID=2321398 RepID=UPI002941E10C|nr:hypothetical protein [uncultured Tyzzerella sp.]
MDKKESFIIKDEEEMGKCIDILKGEEELIKNGLLSKSKDELLNMLKSHPKYKECLSKQEIIEILTDNLNN